MKIPTVGPKIKVVESIWCDLSKLVREGQKVNEKRFSSIGLVSFEKKPKNYLTPPAPQLRLRWFVYSSDSPVSRSPNQSKEWGEEGQLKELPHIQD